MPKLMCVKCEVELRPETNGVRVAEMFQRNTQIYKIWDADKWKCPLCGFEVIAGFADKPLMQHFEGDIEKVVSTYKEMGREIIYDKEIFD
jgi:predicted RNA-binding Zn-ribbon protein involved in translation (DUF1610 family)